MPGVRGRSQREEALLRGIADLEPLHELGEVGGAHPGGRASAP